MKLVVNGKPNTDPCPEVAWVPKVVARCPECSGRLLVQVCACETETRKPIEDGIEVDCENEDLEGEIERGDRPSHRHWQGEWMPVRDRVRRWAMRRIRVATEAQR